MGCQSVNCLLIKPKRRRERQQGTTTERPQNMDETHNVEEDKSTPKLMKPNKIDLICYSKMMATLGRSNALRFPLIPELFNQLRIATPGWRGFPWLSTVLVPFHLGNCSADENAAYEDLLTGPRMPRGRGRVRNAMGWPQRVTKLTLLWGNLNYNTPRSPATFSL